MNTIIQLFDLFPDIDKSYPGINNPLPLYALYFSDRKYNFLAQENIKLLRAENMGQKKIHLFNIFEPNFVGPLHKQLRIDQVTTFIQENFSDTDGVFIFDTRKGTLCKLHNSIMRTLIEYNSQTYIENIEGNKELYDPFVRSVFPNRPMYLKDIYDNYHRVTDVKAKGVRLEAKFSSGYSSLILIKYTASTKSIIHKDATELNIKNLFLGGKSGVVNTYSQRWFNKR